MAYELIYTLINNDTEYEVSGYTGEPIDVIIPKEYNGLPVTSIGNLLRYIIHIFSIFVDNQIPGHQSTYWNRFLNGLCHLHGIIGCLDDDTALFFCI